MLTAHSPSSACRAPGGLPSQAPPPTLQLHCRHGGGVDTRARQEFASSPQDPLQAERPGRPRFQVHAGWVRAGTMSPFNTGCVSAKMSPNSDHPRGGWLGLKDCGEMLSHLETAACSKQTVGALQICKASLSKWLQDFVAAQGSCLTRPNLQGASLSPHGVSFALRWCCPS